MYKTIISGILALSLVGCASEANRNLLANYERQCTIGDRTSCQLADTQRQINADEAKANAVKGVAIGILIPLVVLAAVAGAQAEQNSPPPLCYSYFSHHYYPC